MAPYGKPLGNYYEFTILPLLYVMLMVAGHCLKNLKPTYLPTTYLTHFNHTTILSLQPKSKKLKAI